VKINLEDDIKAISERLNVHGFDVKIIKAQDIDPTQSWVPGEGGFHNHTLTTFGDRRESWKTQWSTLIR